MQRISKSLHLSSEKIRKRNSASSHYLKIKMFIGNISLLSTEQRKDKGDEVININSYLRLS